MKSQAVALSKYKKAGLHVLVVIYLGLMLTMTAGVSKILLKTHSLGFSFIYPCTTRGDTDVSDFVLLYAAGSLNRERITSHRELNVYSPALITQSIERIMAPWQPVELYTIQYPPMVFFLTTPIAALPITAAFESWVAASLAALSSSYFILVWGRIKSRIAQAAGFILIFTSIAVWELFYNGQSSSFELLAVTLSLSLLQRSRLFLSGLAAGLTLLKIQHAPMAVLPGLCVGRTRFAAGFALSVFIQAVVASFVVGSANMLNFIHINYLCELSHEYYAHNEPWDMHNFRCLLNCANPHGPVTQIAIGVYVAVVAFVCFAWLVVYPRLKDKCHSSFYLLASISTMLVLFFGLHAFDYDYLFMLIPCAFLYIYACADQSASPPILRSLLRIACALYPLTEVIVAPLWTCFCPRFGLAFRQQATDAFCLAPLLVLAMLALLLELKGTQSRLLTVTHA